MNELERVTAKGVRHFKGRERARATKVIFKTIKCSKLCIFTAS